MTNTLALASNASLAVWLPRLPCMHPFVVTCVFTCSLIHFYLELININFGPRMTMGHLSHSVVEVAFVWWFPKRSPYPTTPIYTHHTVAIMVGVYVPVHPWCWFGGRTWTLRTWTLYQHPRPPPQRTVISHVQNPKYRPNSSGGGSNFRRPATPALRGRTGCSSAWPSPRPRRSSLPRTPGPPRRPKRRTGSGYRSPLFG